MSDVIITVENLGKKYRIAHQGDRPRYTALRDVLANKFKGIFGNRKSEIGNRKSAEDFWALKDVSFEVKQGEVVGIIGRNGAGKSTLLKILSRITEPTEGRVRIKGRVASLLEVGTGFHPELTGRENIFLNGAILGMHRAEIKRKFDEIVAFAEVKKFLDTPVKRYSSGMYVRLAFAVAAHLEPEILIVDEVLAVGDAQFQKKCLGKMGEVAKGGRTVLFVSHNMVAVKQLCQTGILLHNGLVKQIGRIDDVTQTYAKSMHSDAHASNFATSRVTGDRQVELVSYRVTNAAGDTSPMPGTKEDVLIHVTLRVKKAIVQPACGISISNEFGVLMTSINTVEQGYEMPPLPSGEVTLCVRVNKTSFMPGNYTASFWVMNPQGHIYVMTEDSIALEIAQVPLYGTSNLDHRWGCVYSDVKFDIQR